MAQCYRHLHNCLKPLSKLICDYLIHCINPMWLLIWWNVEMNIPKQWDSKREAFEGAGGDVDN